MPTIEKNEVRMVGVLPSQGADPIPVRLSTEAAGAGMIEKNEVRMVGVLPSQGADPIPVRLVTDAPGGGMIEKNEVRMVGILPAQGADPIPVTGIQGVPSGCILIWSGAVGDIPNGWVLCNGANETPDLRDRFIVGAGSTYGVGDTGGENTHTLTIPEIPSHRHTLKEYNTYNGLESISYAEASSPRTKYTGYEGGGDPHENRPPYYALCYIMKT